jgi:small ubiquitin-related modifier
MSKVIASYASRKGIQLESLRFLLDGVRIKGDDTPESLDLEDQDQVDCMLEQTGGM